MSIKQLFNSLYALFKHKHLPNACLELPLTICVSHFNLLDFRFIVIIFLGNAFVLLLAVPLLTLRGATPGWGRRYWLTTPVDLPAGTSVAVQVSGENPAIELLVTGR